MLSILEELPDGLLDAPASELYRILSGPSLIHLPGRRPEPLFVSVLLHGNEHTGLTAVQSVLRGYAGQTLPRALSLFVGNVAAARHGLRRLDGQPDYNRVWPGAEDDGTPEHAMAAAVVEAMRPRKVFASIDIHNNTGLNPHYACVTHLAPPFLHLARLFGRTMVFFTRPKGVQSWAFGEFCPAVAVECGKPGNPGGEAHAADFLRAALNLSELPSHPLRSHEIDLYHTVGIVRVPAEVDFSFDSEDTDLRLDSGLEYLNFREVAAGTEIARVRRGLAAPLQVIGEDDRPVGDRYFEVVDDRLLTSIPFVPAMLTLDRRVIRQDCLCYAMERLPL
jgi:succinylglutamate desuccinylase